MKLCTFVFSFALISYSASFSQSASVSAPSKEWTAIQGIDYYLEDPQPSLSESNIVGLGADYGLFVTHNEFGSESSTDGTFGFRIRLDAAGGTKKDPKYTKAAWLGIDANSDDIIDVFIGVNFSGSDQQLGIFEVGSGDNNTPGSTSVNSGTPYKTYTIGSDNYNYRPVNNPTDGGEANDLNTGKKVEPDYYLSVLVDFADVVKYLSEEKGIEVNDQSPMRFISATSRQGSNLDQDIGGVSSAKNTDVKWGESGGMTQSVTVNGVLVIPEPSCPSLLLLGSLLALTLRRRKRT